jgi:hypothetical protein
MSKQDIRKVGGAVWYSPASLSGEKVIINKSGFEAHPFKSSR